MIKFKQLPFRQFTLLLPFLFLVIIYHAAIEHILFFNANAPDLSQFDGQNIKRQLLTSMLSIENSLYEYNFFQSFLFPILIIFVAFSYHFIKTRHLKYMIGKTAKYSKRIFYAKLQMGCVVASIFSVILVVVIMLALLVNRMDYQQLQMYFSNSSLLRGFSHGVWLYLLYYFCVKTGALLCQTLFACYLVDYFSNYSKAAIAFLLLLWGTAPILYAFLPFYLVPMSNLMVTSYGSITLWQILLTYLPFILIYGILKVRKSYEVD